MNFSAREKSRRAFTLVELLVAPIEDTNYTFLSTTAPALPALLSSF